MRFSEWRARLGLSQAEAAERCGVKQGEVSRWEAGKRSPTLRKIARIKEITGGLVTYDDWMASGNGEPPVGEGPGQAEPMIAV